MLTQRPTHCKTTSPTEVMPDLPLSRPCPLLLEKRSPWRTCTFLRSSYRCDSEDWPVINGKQELISLLLANGRAKIISLSAKNNRSFDWFVITREEKPERSPGGESASAEIKICP